MPVFGERVPGVEYRPRPSAYALVADATGERVAVLLTRIGYYLPGGGMDPGEDVATTVRREGIEEAGLVLLPGVAIGEALEIVHTPSEGCGYEKASTFVVAHVEGNATATEPDHVLEWMPVGEARERLASPSHRWAVELFARRSRA
jgi:8-oxo-dGTP diphosphatase